MTIKKLTVAAAIAVGIATCSFSSAMAACPVSGCNTCPTTVAPAMTCPSCGQNSSTCGCQSKSSCGCDEAPACGCSVPACAAPAAPCKVPACATCPSTSCNDLDMKQVYAYPNAIYGTNNYTGEQSNAIYSTETAFMTDCCENSLSAYGGYGYTGAAAPFAPGCNCAPTPCGCADSGVAVDRGCSKKCNTGCGCNTGYAAPCASMPIINEPLSHSSCGCTGAAAPCGCNTQCGSTIGTSNSIQALKRSFEAFMPTTSQVKGMTGAASPLSNAFPDVPSSYWAACPIDKLAMCDIVVGYPDNMFKPNRDISRAEFATMMVKGYNLNCACLPSKCIFSDVPKSHWANALIAKAVEEGIMCGYPNNKFKPAQPVSRVEALTAMAHGINCDIDSCKAKEILSQYSDGNSVPDWAAIPVAKALQSGALKTSPNCNSIKPCDEASRAEIADMLQNTRVALGLTTDTTACACPAPVEPCNKQAYMETEQVVNIPTLKLCFKDEINAKSSNAGDQFAATTSEDVTINGKCFKAGSRVNGKIVEVIRPSGCQKGCLKVAFTNIEGCDCKVDLPRQILSAKVECAKTQNIFSRIIAAPFTLVGGLLGTTGRTVGGMIASAGNAAEAVSGGTGIAMGEILQGPCQFRAAGRSLQDAAKAAIIAPVDFTRTALSGTMGLFQTTGDEVAYLVDPNGTKISAINPKEKVTIAFGCH